MSRNWHRNSDLFRIIHTKSKINFGERICICGDLFGHRYSESARQLPSFEMRATGWNLVRPFGDVASQNDRQQLRAICRTIPRTAAGMTIKWSTL